MDFTRGMDVSHYEPVIDWQAARDDGIKYVFVKTTQGIQEDAVFQRLWSEAKGIMPRGGYHLYDGRFYFDIKKPQRQVEKFLQALNGDLGELPLVIDIEGVYATGAPYGGWKNWYSFIANLRDAIPADKEIMIYTNRGTWDSNAPVNEYELEWFTKYPLWVAEYNNLPEPMQLPRGFSEWLFYQYSETGIFDWARDFDNKRVGVDLNWFNGNLAAFNKRFGFVAEAPEPPVDQTPASVYPIITMTIQAAGYYDEEVTLTPLEAEAPAPDPDPEPDPVIEPIPDPEPEPQSEPAGMLYRVKWPDGTVPGLQDPAEWGTGNFAVVQLAPEYEGQANISVISAVSSFLTIPRAQIDYLKSLQFPESLTVDQKMNKLCDYRGRIYMYADETDSWKTAASIRWGHIALGGNLVMADKKAVIRGDDKCGYGVRNYEAIRLVCFKKKDINKVNHQTHPHLIHRFTGVSKTGEHLEAPHGTIYTPLWSPLDWDIKGTKKCVAFWLPLTAVEPA